MPKLTVLTVSKRTGWEELAVKSLERQTFKDFKWLIVQEKLDGWQMPYLGSLDATVMFAPKKKNVSNLNASENAGFRQINTEYVMFYQDFIELEKDTIKKLMESVDSRCAVTTATINHDGTMDSRYLGLDELHECLADEWETNVAIAPMKMIRDVGGSDERLDAGWAWNNVSIARRAKMLGYGFLIDERVKPQLHFHVKEPDLDPTLKTNGELNEKIMRKIIRKEEPIKLNYL